MDVGALETEALSAIAATSTLDWLDDLRVRYLGRKSELSSRCVRWDRETGMALNAARERLEPPLPSATRRSSARRLDLVLAEDAVDVTLPGERPARGHLHLITQIRREVEDIFLGMGYEVIDGREVETPEYLFDALNMPLGHPTRSPQHTFYLSDEALLRSETSPSQIHVMEAKKPPIYIVSLGRCYRRDPPDATHFPIFHQVEGLAVDRGITLADLKGTLLQRMRALFGEERAMRFRTHYFPFTEPSHEPDVSCFACDGAGCRVCKHSAGSRWAARASSTPTCCAGSGTTRRRSPVCLRARPERIAQLRHGIPDIRLLWENDLRVLRRLIAT
jgi:phenylalanyl-tRNA synthetase alpha chain